MQEQGKGGGKLEVASHRILEARTTLEVTIECVGDIQNALDVLHAERLAIVDCQGLGGADSVLDLIASFVSIQSLASVG